MTDLLPPDVLANLRALDPVGDRPALAAAQLESAEQDVLDRAELDTEVFELVSPPPSASHRLTGRPFMAAAAAVLIAGLGLTVSHLRNGGSADPSPSVSGATRPVPARYRTIAQQLLPLTANMSVDCQGVVVPVAMLAEPGGAEHGTYAVSAALRIFLAHNHSIAGMQPLTGGNWLLLSETSKRLVFGQRHGAIGVGTALALDRHGTSLTFSSSGGCGPVVTGLSQQGEGFDVGSTKGSTLTLSWSPGSNCGTGPAKTDRVVSRVLIEQNAHTVHLLLLSKPSPDAGPVSGACAQVGLSATATVELSAPLGGRTLYDDSSTPVTVVKPE